MDSPECMEDSVRALLNCLRRFPIDESSIFRLGFVLLTFLCVYTFVDLFSISGLERRWTREGGKLNIATQKTKRLNERYRFFYCEGLYVGIFAALVVCDLLSQISVRLTADTFRYIKVLYLA